MATRPLTSQQQKVLAFLSRFLQQHGFPPTLREIGEALDLSSLNAVRGHLSALEKKGYIKKAPDKARSIQIVRSPSALSRVKRKLHEVLGTDEGVFHRVVYGLAWTTWRRTPWLTGPTAQWMSEAIDAEATEHGWQVLERHIRPECVLIVIAVWPNHSPERTLHRLQSAGAAVRRRCPDDFHGKPLWGRGYVATTERDMLEALAQKLLDHQSGGARDSAGTS